MFTIEAERDGLKEQTLKKCVLQGKIRLTVNIKKKKILKVEEEEERKKWDIPSQEQTLQKKKKYNKVCGETHIFRMYIH